LGWHGELRMVSPNLGRWLIGQPGVGAVARAATLDHVRENRGALDLRLTLEDFAELDRSFPPQIQPRPAELR